MNLKSIVFSDNSDYTKMSNISKDLLFSTSTTTTITKNFDTLLFPSGSTANVEVSKLDFKGFNGLQSVTIEDNNFSSVNEVQVIGIESLLSMTVGKNCFTKKVNKRLLIDEDNSGSFVIADCPKFQSLSIGPQSFTEFTSFNATSRIHLK